MRGKVLGIFSDSGIKLLKEGVISDRREGRERVIRPTRQRIWYNVSRALFVDDGEVKRSQTFHPADLSWAECLLSEDVGGWVVVGLHSEVGTAEVVTPNGKRMHHSEKFTFMHGIVALSRNKLAALIGDDVLAILSSLAENSTDGEVRGVRLDRKRQGEVGWAHDRRGAAHMFDVVEGGLLFRSPHPWNRGLEEVGKRSSEL